MTQKFRTLELAIKQYQQIKELKFKGEVRSQIERAALSVCLNLTEGSAKQTKRDRVKFFNTSYASQQEVKCLLMIEDITDLLQSADILAAHLYRLQSTAYGTLSSGHRSQVTGHRSQVTGHRSQVTGHRSQVTG